MSKKTILNTVFNEDCLGDVKKKTGMWRIADSSVDLVVTDIPYKLTGGGTTANTKMGGSTASGKIGVSRNKNVFKHNDIKPSDYFSEIFRVMKEGTHFYCMVNDRNLEDVLTAAKNSGFILINILVWDKGMHSPTPYFLKNIEFVPVFRKGKARDLNKKGVKTLVSIPGIKGKQHPSEKPEKLMELFIEISSNEGDTVYDPFMGSFTTAIAALNTKRNYIGFEMDEHYFALGTERVNNHVSELHVKEKENNDAK